MVALELLRAASNWNDLGLGTFELRYVRNKEKEEIDFLITKDAHPWLLLEVKSQEDQVSKTVLKFQSLLKIPAVQLVNKPGVSKAIANGPHRTLVITASRWLAALP